MNQIHSARRMIAARSGGALVTLACLAGPLSAQGTVPTRLEGRTSDVLVLAPAGRDPAADERRLGQLIAACRVAFEISPADSALFVSREAPEPALDVWQIRDAIVIVVMPRQELFVDCDDPAQATLAASRGLRVTLDGNYNTSFDIARVIVRRGSRELRPLADERHAVQRLGVGGFHAPRAKWGRLSFHRDEFAPGPGGTVDDITVEVIHASGNTDDRIAIPWRAVRAAWESSLAARPVLGATIAPPLPLTAPADARLAEMNAAYTAGEQERALRLAAPHFASANASARRDARTHAAMSLLALGDTNSARVVVGALMQDAPCLTVAAGAPAAARDLVASADRPTARCEAQTPRRTMLKAALMPGFAVPGSGARADQRLLVLAASVGASAAAFHMYRVAHDRYDRYRAYQARLVAPGEVNSDIQGLHREAESARKISLTLGTIGALVWVGQGVLALRHERRFVEELRRVQGVGDSQAVRVSPSAGPSGIGLTLSLSW